MIQEVLSVQAEVIHSIAYFYIVVLCGFVTVFHASIVFMGLATLVGGEGEEGVEGWRMGEEEEGVEEWRLGLEEEGVEEWKLGEGEEEEEEGLEKWKKREEEEGVEE